MKTFMITYKHAQIRILSEYVVKDLALDRNNLGARVGEQGDMKQCKKGANGLPDTKNRELKH